jgi:molecular chaperone GrpE
MAKTENWMDRFGPFRGQNKSRTHSNDGADIEENRMNTEQMEEETEPTTAQVDVEAGMESPADPHTELEQARGERDQLAQQLAQTQDRLARLQAEFDNARKREIKERQDTRDYAIQSAVDPFLGVMDNFALALGSEGDITQLRTGVQLILKQMDEALRSLNVQPVEAVGTQFDPRVHEALGSVDTVEHPDHQVLEEIRRGYKLRDKLLRPALVKIANNPAQRSE